MSIVYKFRRELFDPEPMNISPLRLHLDYAAELEATRADEPIAGDLEILDGMQAIDLLVAKFGAVRVGKWLRLSATVRGEGL